MGNFFGNLGEKLQSFMIGRNGPDRLGRWVIVAGLIFAIINIFLPNIVCSILCYVCLFYAIYRMLSTNIADRRRENEKLESLLSKMSGRKGGASGSGGDASYFKGKGSAKGKSAASGSSRASAASDPTKTTFKCEQCGQSLSVPKGRGTLKVTCPKCHHQQKVKS